MELKECYQCGESYPLTKEFWKQYSTKTKEKRWRKRCRKCINSNFESKYRPKYRDRESKYVLTVKGVFSGLKIRARVREIPFNLSLDDFTPWYDSQERVCHYCGLKEEFMRLVDDGVTKKNKRLSIDRIDSSKGYEIGNIVLACLRCNVTKSDILTYEQMLRVGKIVRSHWPKEYLA